MISDLILPFILQKGLIGTWNEKLTLKRQTENDKNDPDCTLWTTAMPICFDSSACVGKEIAKLLNFLEFVKSSNSRVSCVIPLDLRAKIDFFLGQREWVSLGCKSRPVKASDDKN